MTFTSGQKIDFTSTKEMTFSSDAIMTIESNISMVFGTGIRMEIVWVSGPNPGYIEPCTWLQVIWPAGFLPEICSWWEAIDPNTGAALGEFHVDAIDPGPNLFHVDEIFPQIPIRFPMGGVILAEKKIHIVEPCDYYEVHWPPHWWPEPCTWWEIIDPDSGRLTGYEFHVDWTNSSCEFHIDDVWPEPWGPWYYGAWEIEARKKIPSLKPCDTFRVVIPPDWGFEPCTWWEVIDPYTGEPSGFQFHIDDTSDGTFHIDQVHPPPDPDPIPFPWYPPTLNVTVVKKIEDIRSCSEFVVIDPAQFLPERCSWWEVLDDSGAPTGYEFHVDSTDGISKFHVDSTIPGGGIPLEPTPTITAREKIDVIEACIWYKVDDPATTPVTCTWWEVLDPTTGEPTGWEFHVDEYSPTTGWFHVDQVIPGPTPIPVTHMLKAEKKIDDIQPCDWFVVIDPTTGWVPQPCSWWTITWPPRWAGIKFHIDQSGDGIFHVDYVDHQIPVITPPPWNVTADPYEPPPPPWFIKRPYRDYAPSGIPDFDQKQDTWGPGVGIFTWCGPVSVANSLWWLDSEFEPTPIPPPIINDNFNLVTSYNAGVWDDHDVKNVEPLVRDLAWHMDTDAVQSGDGHIGTRWEDMEAGIKQYLIQQGVDTLFEVHNYTFPDFGEIVEEVLICQDVVLFLKFFQEDLQNPGEWIRLYDNPSLEYGHFVTVAGVNSTTVELLISDPIQDAFEAGATTGQSPFPHPYPHSTAVHNDTMFVSHDAYQANLWIAPPMPYPSPYGIPVWELMGYLQTMGYDPTWHAFIEAAVVTSPLGVHDVAVTNLTSAKSVICQGYTGNVTVTVENQGDFAETFNVTVYANATEVIGAAPVSLPIGGSTDIVFLWDTTGYSKGNYTLRAQATVVSGETDTADNTYVDGWVIISMIGDITGPDGWPDGKCDMRDVGLCARYFGQNAPPAPTICDVVYDGKVDMRDIGLVARHFGETDP
jgi:hypothetical protein